jgi:hypothetical protein
MGARSRRRSATLPAAACTHVQDEHDPAVEIAGRAWRFPVQLSVLVTYP